MNWDRYSPLSLKECFAASKTWTTLFSAKGPLDWDALLATSPRKNAQAVHQYLQMAESANLLWLGEREVLQVPLGARPQPGDLLAILQAGGHDAFCLACLEDEPWTFVVTHEQEWQFLFQVGTQPDESKEGTL